MNMELICISKQIKLFVNNLKPQIFSNLDFKVEICTANLTWLRIWTLKNDKALMFKKVKIDFYNKKKRNHLKIWKINRLVLVHTVICKLGIKIINGLKIWLLSIKISRKLNLNFLIRMSWIWVVINISKMKTVNFIFFNRPSGLLSDFL